MTKTKLLSLAPFVVFFGFIPYLFLLWAFGDPRVQQDLTLDEKNMNAFESLLFNLAFIGILVVWVRSLWRLYSKQQYGWLAAVFFIWPVTAFYVWKEE
ncbi:MAG TPA: hypothetical protein VGH80_14470 [Xanthomonadaceae bacterium]|jgi:hypothetical protein